MKYYHKYIILPLSIIIFLFSSCHVSVPCDRVIISIGFISFPDKETDSFILRRYEQGKNYTTLIDTVLLNRSNSSYAKSNDSLKVTHAVDYQKGLSSFYNYEVYLPISKTTFRISDIDEKFKKWKAGFTSDSSSCKNLIRSYKVNGQKIRGEFTTLTIYLKR